MSQKIVWGIVIVVVIAGLWYFSKKSSVSTTEELPTEGSVSELQNGTYMLDVAQSKIEWTGSKTLIRDYYDNGTLLFSNGNVTVSGGAVTAGAFTVDMKTFSVTSTSNTKATGDMLANHLKSADFFDVATYPVAVVGVKSVDGDMVTADVTIKGITKPVTFPAAISQDGDTITASAKFAIDRTLWDIRYGSTKFFGDLGDNVINDSVNLTLTLVATKTQ